MNKYQKFVRILEVCTLISEAKNGYPGKAPAALARAYNANALETAVNVWGITADGDNNRIDIKPVEGMVVEYLDFVYANAPKPEWLAHTSL